MSKGWRLRAACMCVALGMVSGGLQAADKTVLIGFAGPMSGLSGSTGVSLERAAQLAVDDLNQSKPVIGGEPVVFKLLPQDDRADPRTGELVAQYFVKAKVAAVVGHWNSGVSIPASKIYAAAGVVQVSPATTSVNYTRQGFKTAFRAVPHDGDGARHTAAYVINDLHAARIVLIDDRTLFGAGYADNFAQAVAQAGTAVVSRYSVSAKSSDFNSILRSARNQNPDVVVFAGLDAQAAQLASDVRRLGIKARMVGIGGVVGPTFLGLAGDSAEGMTVLEPGPASYKGPQWAHFEKTWKAKYKEPIYLYAPFAYDAVRVIAAAMLEANSTGSAALAEALHRIRYRGISGNIGFDKEGNLVEPVFTLYQVRNGQWRPMRTIGDRG